MNPRSICWFLLLLSAPLLGGCGLVRVERAPVTIAAPAAEPEPVLEGAASEESLAFYYFSLANLRASEDDLDGALKALEQARKHDPRSSYLDLALAEVYLREGDEKQAQRAVEDALGNDPGSIEAHTMLGRFYFNQEAFPKAIEQFRAALALAPNDEQLLLQLVIALARNGDTADATDALKTFIGRHPQVIDSPLALAHLYQETGLDALAEATYRQILKDHPKSREARLGLARFYESRPEKLDRALEIYRTLLSEKPGDVHLRNHLAALLINAGKLDAARDELESLLTYVPGNLDVRRKLGLIAIEQEHWGRAIDLFRGLLAQRPDLEQARYYLGVALENQGDTSGALETFAGIAAHSPYADDALMHRAYLLAASQHPKKAIALLEARLAEPVDRADLYLMLVSLYVDTHQDQQAMARADQGLKAFPDNLRLHYQRGVLLDRAGKEERAAAEMTQVLKLDPEHAEALNYLAYRWAERGENLQQALQYARRALKKSDKPYIRDTLGWVLFRMGDYDAALKQLQLAADGLPDDPIVLEHLADACHAAGLNDLAVLYYRRLLKKDPDNKSLKSKLETSLKQLKN